MKHVLTFFLFVFCYAGVIAQLPQPILRDTSGGGRFISRAMHLLETSNPNKRNTFKILVYGQSISEQDWWKEVKQKLQERYPFANLIMINRAIGGFSSQMLWKTVEMDVTSFYPDLVLFHVYGSHIDYETIIKIIRSRTTAEVIIQTDHITKDSEITDYFAHSSDLNFSIWENKMSFVFEPGFAEKYKCELIQVRKHWIDYLTDNGFSPAQFLRDGVHLNENGNALMAAIIEPNLRRNPVYADPDPLGLVRTYYANSDFNFGTDSLVFSFEGNKVDVVLDDDSHPADSFSVFVDGVSPCRFQGVYNYTRPYDHSGGSFPWSMGCWYYLQYAAPWNDGEVWSCQINSINQAHDNFAFTITGSKTGVDGTGSAGQNFISSSGKVIIAKDDWHIKRTHDVTGFTIQPGYTFYWETYSMAKNTVIPQENSLPGTENTVSLFQGIVNTKHTLLLVKRGNQWPVKAVRVYRPFWDRQDTFFLQVSVPVLSFQKTGGTSNLAINSNTCWKIKTGNSWVSTNIKEWSEDAVLQIAVKENNGMPRTDTVFIEGTGVPLKKVIINQEGIPMKDISTAFDQPFKIYPVPSRGLLMVHSFEKLSEYCIIGIDGRILASGHFDQGSSEGLYTLSLGGLNPGKYWMRVFCSGKSQALPFVIL